MSDAPMPQPEHSDDSAKTTATAVNPIGVIAIGRNEGERLRLCLESVVGKVAQVVYVDSGSTDGSAELAKSLGVEVVDLDLSIPFTAARARNEGFARLQEVMPDVKCVQMIDGDCEVVDGWLETAAAYLDAYPKFAVACGRRRERFPEATIYNRLTDMEWDTPIGMARSCGGDALFRAEALREVGGYNPTVIAGEEPEMCVRLRQAGWTIERLDAEMTLHDAAMTKFSQWWKRNVRAGHAYAQGAAMHGKTDGHNVKQVRSIVFWGMLIPLFIAGLFVVGFVIEFTVLEGEAWYQSPLILVVAMIDLLLLGYLVLAFKIWRYRCGLGDPGKTSAIYAFFTVVGKFANAIGVGTFWKNHKLGKQAKIIEYKSAEGATA
ncbi:glycosyltransferase [Algisphaera agarilytica]|uniref:GT2 family glycosyltransferase n=1 Tax=Algisphaera agarilytica TaxID=1385975 RepID=A0A7X0H7G8_9BACT|nr:glycosyltransferase [Algisphaera agarilytica]MBB6430447.1 GT2 family glycosyltransferase [Algisphaera agarilytica]